MQSKNVEGIGRVYYTDTFSYPSVTTVLQVVGDKTYLENWREQVGAEFADKYTKIACDIGTAMHNDYECYLAETGLKECETDEERQARRMFNASVKKFDSLFHRKPVMQEVAVVSHKYRIAGRFDLIANGKDGKTYLVDFKNTKRDKSRSDIDAYKFQLAFYHRMLGETHPEIAIDEHLIFMVNRDCFTKIFRFSTDEVTDTELMKIRGRFYKEYGL